jgi:hypothetical protein
MRMNSRRGSRRQPTVAGMLALLTLPATDDFLNVHAAELAKGHATPVIEAACSQNEPPVVYRCWRLAYQVVYRCWKTTTGSTGSEARFPPPVSRALLLLPWVVPACCICL